MKLERRREANRRNNKAWRERNRDHVMALNREKSKRYYDKNVDAVREAMRTRANRRYASLTQKERREKRLKDLYDLTQEQFEEMLALQDGRCAGCQTDTPGARGFHVDHCHDTGKVRGILCSKCNTGLGLANDSVETLKRWIAYLEKER